MYQPPVPGPELSGMPDGPSRTGKELGAWLIVALPLVLGVFLFVATPTYFRPLFQSALGWSMLAVVVALEAAAFGAVSWGNRRFGGRAIALKLFTMLVMVGLVFPTLWLLLLGPAILIIITSRGG